MKSVAIILLGAMLLYAKPLIASEEVLDGDWQGEGSSTSSECPDFDFLVSVKDNRVHGKAHQTGTDYRVDGVIGADGAFTGSVTFMSFKIAELKGEIRSEKGDGEWKTLKGPDCQGDFLVWKLTG